MQTSLNVKVENTSAVLRKLTITVPADQIKAHFDKGYAQAQKTAKVKGFRPGHVPMPMIRKLYAEGIKHQVFQNVIDESFKEALKSKKIRAVGRPKLETDENQKEPEIVEGQELTFSATVEVVPEIEVKSYTGLSLTKDKVEIKPEEIDQVVNRIRDMHAEMIAVEGRAIKKGDFAEIDFDGGLIVDGKKESKAEMNGARMVEIGSGELIPGFEDELVGLKAGGEKTFQIDFPKDFADTGFAGKKAEFFVKVKSIKEKKLPEMTDEFAKESGYESVADFKKKAELSLTTQKTEDADRKLKSDLLKAIMEKNTFEVPNSLIMAQTQNLMQDFGQHLKQQGFDETMSRQAMAQEFDNLKKRAEEQVRSSLILEKIADLEKIEVSKEERAKELEKAAAQYRVEPARLEEYYAKNPEKEDDFMYRIREAKTLDFLISKAKIK